MMTTMTKVRRNLLGRALACLAAAWLTVGVVGTALAQDVITTTDGKTYEGEIVRETDAMVYVKIKIGTIERTITIWKDKIDKIEREADQAAAEADDKSDSGRGDATGGQQNNEEGEEDLATALGVASADNDMRASSESARTDPNAKRIVVIPLYEMVGHYFRSDKIEESIRVAEEYEPEIIIFQIESGGGMLYELYRIRDTLSELREKYRLVAWVKTAISAAAMTAVNCPEIYFMNEGNMGAATAFNPGTGQSIQGAELEQWLNDAAAMAEAGGHNGLVVKAMIDPRFHVTADIEVLPNGKKNVTFYEGNQGDHLVSPAGKILSLTAYDAEKFGFSLGTADDVDELARFLNLDNWVEVTDKSRKVQEDWWATLDAAKIEVPKLAMRLDIYSTGSRTDLGRQAEILRELIRWAKRLGDEPAQWGAAGVPLDRRSLEMQLDEIRRALRRSGG